MLNRFICILFIYVCISIVCVIPAYSQDDQIVWGAGIGSGDSYGTRMLSLGIQEDLWYALKQRGTVGGWFDPTGNGRSSSVLASGQLGFEVNSRGTVVSIFTGPCLISTPDSYLGGYFQFMTDAHIGLQDNDVNYLGVFYRHISSAGIENPNVGRDIMGLELKF